MTILEYLRSQGVDIAAPCGGYGACGKCLVTVDGGAPLLACRIEYREGSVIKVIGDGNNDNRRNEGYNIIAADTDGNSSKKKSPEVNNDRKYTIAVDIGTTTLAAALIDPISGEKIRQETCLNSNRAFGADVISRIRSGMEGHLPEMRERLQNDLRELISNLTEDIRTVDTIVLAGNTAMIHTLMGYDLSSLGTYPYEPVNISMIEGKTGDILEKGSQDLTGMISRDISEAGSDALKSPENSHCVILPSASAFIGGDIISGLYYLEALRDADPSTKSNAIYALMDLGTNGEIALVTDNGIYCASTAAGPVFEGGGISCGIGSITGAIDHVSISGNNITCSQIGGSESGDHLAPKGLCGSGVIDCAAEIFKAGLCDERGTFIDPDVPVKIADSDDGSGIFFTQEDMRQVQLAKAAVSAGFRILCREAGIDMEDISALYLAGGLGYSIRPSSAAAIRLVDPALKDKIIPVGNTSLLGAIRFSLLYDRDGIDRISTIKDRCRVIDLASDPSFQDLYIADMDL
ncbi:MAG: ASKHA domain-containing protein [Lachnospiraceae bacterium]|nr:ASKHA domain-containing protein [Lachnospiraceae bacterium]